MSKPVIKFLFTIPLAKDFVFSPVLHYSTRSLTQRMREKRNQGVNLENFVHLAEFSKIVVGFWSSTKVPKDKKSVSYLDTFSGGVQPF